jgi:acyl-CoA synthetase (AMP-forming)/AMP-acid ligase II
MGNPSQRLNESIERLVSRDDVWMTRELVDDFLASGRWKEESFVDYLERSAEKHPDAPAIVDEDGKVTTYREYDRQASSFALGLLEIGIRPGDRIAIQLPNCSQFLIALMGAAKAGVLPVLCHMPYTVHDLDYVFELTQAKALILPDKFRNRNYLDMIPHLKEKHACLTHVIVLSADHHEGTIGYQSLLDKGVNGDRTRLRETRPVGTDPFFLMFTSGTTGRPKAELHLHANNLYWVNQFSAILQFPQDAKWLIVTPIAHLTGLGIGCLGALYRAAPVVLLSAWDVGKAVEVIERERPTYFLGAPPMLIDLARFEGLEQRDIRSVRVIAYAGATCPADILQTLDRRMGCGIIAFYGYTEAGVTHCTRSGDGIDVTSMSFGKLVDGLEERVVDTDGKVLSAPCEGEVWVRGASFIPGYYGQPQNTHKMFDKDGWFHSADIVRINQSGYCTFVSRRDDLINRGGYKIDPREIEEVLYTHPGIAQAAIIAMPDERLGQRASAFIVLKDASQSLTLNDITAFLEEKGVSKTHWPEALKIVDSFPMTSTGKFQRYALREQAKALKSERQ